MTLLNDKDRAAVRTQLEQTLTHPVALALVVADRDCDLCELTRELLEEVGGLHPKLRVTVYDLKRDAVRVAQLGIDKVPAIAVLDGESASDYGIRFYGIPSGYEFATLLEAIRMAGSGVAELQPATRAFLGELHEPLHLQVFVTPSCPYCPRAAVLAHRLAYASPQITADVVEVSEFPELGERYHVMGVPRTVIGEHVFVEGAAPEGMLVGKLEEALGSGVSM